MIIKQLNYKNRIDLELKHGYLGNFIFHALMNMGFKYNKLNRSLYKSYYYKSSDGKDYLEDRYQNDLNYIKSIDSHYDHYIFDLINHHSNIKRS